MTLLEATGSFLSGNPILTLITVVVIGGLLGPKILRLYQRIRGYRTCPHCGARMKVVTHNGEKYWSCTQCPTWEKVNS